MVLNIDTPNCGASSLNVNPLIVGEPNALLSLIGRSHDQKTDKITLELIDIIH